MSDYYKSPTARLDFDFNWSDWLAPDEAITSHPITITPNDAGLVLDATEEGDGRVKAWLEGGTLGTEYAIACQVETDQGRIDTRTLTVLVRNR